MLKYLIFFALILFIQNKLTDDGKKYLNEIYYLTKTTETNIIKNFKETLENFQENVVNFVSLKQQISNLEFIITTKDKLKIDVSYSKEDAIGKIKTHIKTKNFRKDGNEELGNLFTKSMEYGINQWKKYDLLFSKGTTMKVLSILTKKISNKFVTIYCTSLDKFLYPFGEVVLINKSINENNPFNNNYFMYHYQLECIKARTQKCLIISKSAGKYITLPYADILIRYYSILSYNMIAKEISLSFTD